MTTRKKKSKYFTKIPTAAAAATTTTNTNIKLYKSKEGKTITTFYTFCVKLYV